MTLIASVAHDGGFVCALSDVLISGPRVHRPSIVAIPTRGELVETSTSETEILGVSQKMITAGKSLFLWAGSEIVAEIAIKLLLNASKNGRLRIDVDQTLLEGGITPQDFRNSALIYHYNMGNHVFRRSIGCNPEEIVGNLSIISSGTGSYDFLNNITQGKIIDIGGEKQKYLTEIITRTMYQVISELSSNDSLENLYGGWIEFCSINPNGDFQKVSYAIKIWMVDDRGINIYKPLMYSRYVNDDLYICKWQYVFPSSDETQDTSWTIHKISDFASRQTVDEIPDSAFDFTSMFIAHLVVRENARRIAIKVGRDCSESFCVARAGGKTRMEISKALLEEIERLHDLPFEEGDMFARQTDQ